jgi:adhesin/invasin
LVGCFDPADPSSTADGGGSTSSGTETSMTGMTSAPSTADTSGTSATSATTAPTTITTTTDSDTDAETTANVDSSSEGGSTGPVAACEDGVFVGEAPPLAAGIEVAQLYNTQGAAIVDVDDDGTNDLLLSDFGDSDPEQGGVYVMRGTGNGALADPVKLPSSFLAVKVAAAPISDATVDVVASGAFLTGRGEYTAAVYRWRGNGDGTFLAPTSYVGASDWNAELFDVDGDDRRDLLGTGQAGVIVALASPAETFGANNPYGGIAAVNAARGGDLDGDGDGDIVCAAGDGSLMVLLGDGSGVFADGVSYPNSAGTPIDLSVADFDGDGLLDVATTNGATVIARRGDGTGTLGDEVVLTVQGETLGIAATDFDLDGCADVTVVNNSGSISTIMGRQDFEFTPQEVFNLAVSGYPYGIAAGDLDGDTIADVVAVTAGGSPDSGGEVVVFYSDG